MNMRFNSGKEMLDAITNQCDLYNKNKEIYVFSYNANNSIAYYNIDNKRMNKLRMDAEEKGECLSGLLDAGGYIIDDPSYTDFKEGDYSNLDWCNDNYDGEWVEV